MSQEPSPPFVIESTLNTDNSGTALRIFPKTVYAHTNPGEHELFTIMPIRTINGLRDRDGFLILMPEGSVGRIPLESRNSKKNWTTPRERKNPGQIPFRDGFIQDFPVKSLGAFKKRKHTSQVLSNLVRIEDLYVGIYPDSDLSPDRSPWPEKAEIQAVLKRERKSTRPAMLITKARDSKLEPLDYLERNVERYLTAQGYDLTDGSAPSPLALAIAARARIDGADEPPEGLETLAQNNDDWLSETDQSVMQRHDLARGWLAIGTQKTWNTRSKAWEYMLTGHVVYDILDDVGRELPYIQPYPKESRNEKANAGFTFHETNERQRYHLLSGHPKNPLLTPKPIMRFSFKTPEWGLKADEISEHRPRVITPYSLTNIDGSWHITVPGIKTYLKSGDLPPEAFVAKRRHYAPPSDTRASKPRPEGLRTFKNNTAAHDVEPGLTLDDVIDETGLDQILSGTIQTRPLQPPPATVVEDHADAADAPHDAPASSPEPTLIEDAETTSDGEPAGSQSVEPDFIALDDGNFGALDRFLSDPSGNSSIPKTEDKNIDESKPIDSNDVKKPERTTEQEPPTVEEEPTPPPPAVQRPIIQKRTGPGGRASYGAAAVGPRPPVEPPYPHDDQIKVLDALLSQKLEHVKHLISVKASTARIHRLTRSTHHLAFAILDPADTVHESMPGREIRNRIGRLDLEMNEIPSTYTDHWISTVESILQKLRTDTS